MVQLNPAQEEVINRGLLSTGFNVVLQMPTGAGKTWLAEQAIGAALRSGHRAVYLTPLRALASELLERWRRAFDGFEVGIFTGDQSRRGTYPVSFDAAQLLIMTPERLDACTRSWRSHWRWLPEVGLLVVDELHLLGDAGRGGRLEGALLRATRLNPFMQVLGLSATLGNRAELADWLGGVEFGSCWRQVPIEWRTARYRSASEKPRILEAEVLRCVRDGGQSLVFVQSRRRAEALARQLGAAGVRAGHHHAGLAEGERRELEGEYRAGALRALVSTGTLEMGINLPAWQVVLYDLQSFDGDAFVPLSVNTVWQRAGRAGRRGLDVRGEVVLLAAAWDRGPDRYARGQFERIVSQLSEMRALSEQVLVEVAAGLARTREQLSRNLGVSLAAHQGRLPAMHEVVGEMLRSGMLAEMPGERMRGSILKATRLGRIAVRQMLLPGTLVRLSAELLGEQAGALTFFDLLLLCASTGDCEPVIPADFEELETLAAFVDREHSTWLAAGHVQLTARMGVDGRRLLDIVKTALVVRAWTRSGDATGVAEEFGCYAFEVRRLAESVGRVLSAATALLTPAKRDEDSATSHAGWLSGTDDDPSVAERVWALHAMVTHGVDEGTVTLTFLPGIGGAIARRLHAAGITDIEELALADPVDVVAVRGVSPQRARRWVAEAVEKVRTRSAFTFRETPRLGYALRGEWTASVDPYRLRRALDLQVRRSGPASIVSGGLEPHRVSLGPTARYCDCADFGRGHECKHILAVRIHRSDGELAPLVARLASEQRDGALDLLHLWFGRGA